MTEFMHFDTDAELEQDETQNEQGQADSQDESGEQGSEGNQNDSPDGDAPAEPAPAKPQPAPGVLTTLDDAYRIQNALQAEKKAGLKPAQSAVKRDEIEQALATARKYYGIAKRSKAPEAAGSGELVKELEKFLAERSA